MNYVKNLHIQRESIEKNEYLQNLVKQLDSRHNLLELEREISDIHINYDKLLDEKMLYLGIKYVSLGFKLLENNIDNWKEIVEKGAGLLYMVSYSNKFNSKEYYSLLSSLAFFSSGQYSKAFIILKNIENKSNISLTIGSFLKKNMTLLLEQINKILLHEKENLDEQDIYENLIAKSFANLLEYIYSGNSTYLEKSKDILYDLLSLADLNEDPALYLVFKSLKIIVERYNENSLWGLENLCSDFSGPIFEMAIRNFVFNNPPVTELFPTQRTALEKSLQNSGAVLCLPTSSGKTKIAEITILQTLIEDSTAKVFYIAPFRSLSNEIEQSFGKAFKNLEFKVSSLYGNNSFNKLDRDIIGESQIIIATPEKIKAITRADMSILNDIKLLIVDEGHLVGTGEREILNELIIEEIKYSVRKNQGKIVFLSAVLPNVEVLSQWITGTSNNLEKTNWRPSGQRLGVALWNGKNLDIRWINGSFNSSFLTPFNKSGQRKLYPKDKKQALSYMAYELSKNGAVLIFCPQKRTISSYAEEIYKSFKDKLGIMQWKNSKMLEKAILIYEEAYGNDSKMIEYLKYGIICHYGTLVQEVRQIVEEIIKNEKIKIIIATSTLSQGVNIGVSSVIVTGVQYSQNNNMTYEDFWNTVGRAGRAFTDYEGKIFYFMDDTDERMRRYRYEIAVNYLKKREYKVIQSGLLDSFRRIVNLTDGTIEEFEILLDMIGNNEFIDDEYNYISENIDDTLLSLKYKYEVLYENEDSEWIEETFSNTLAFIQAEDDDEKRKFIKFVKAKNFEIAKKIPNRNLWINYVSSGVPLNTSIFLDDKIEEILTIISEYDELYLVENVILLEKIINEFPSMKFRHNFSDDVINNVRVRWLNGDLFSEILKKESTAENICSRYFSFNIAWGINAIARKLFYLNYENESLILENIAQMVESGLPNMRAVILYNIGITSRHSATQISLYFDFDIEDPIWKIKNILFASYDIFKENLNDASKQWIEILKKNKKSNHKIEKISNFTFTNKESENRETILLVRRHDEILKLVSPDYEYQMPVESTEDLPFVSVSNNSGIYFQYDIEDEVWKIENRNPWQKLKDEMN